jgi:hypothetical protein
MKICKVLIAPVLAAAGLVVIAAPAAAQTPATAPPPAPMSFFVTSAAKGSGDLGGLAGADAICQNLAAVGRGGVTWHAYLSTQGPMAVNARDRIGRGPWHNARGQKIGDSVAQIHMDTVEFGRMGVAMGKNLSLDEKGQLVKGVGDSPNQHDILTGTQPDGRAYPAGEDMTCNNWTSSSTGKARVGHHDKQGGGGGSWNSQHNSRSCAAPDLVATGGAGLLYCFAVN